VQVQRLEKVAGLRLRDGKACVWLDDGTVRCWGRDWFQKVLMPACASPRARRSGGPRSLGRGRTRWVHGPIEHYCPVPTAIAVPGHVIQVAPGSQHICALTRDGTVQCWGANSYGTLGDGSQSDARRDPGKVSF
jgi:alpha-tubulin suppressor-like RCC1 family protein